MFLYNIKLNGVNLLKFTFIIILIIILIILFVSVYNIFLKNPNQSDENEVLTLTDNIRNR